MQRIFLEEKYDIFLTLTEELINHQILFDKSLSNDLFNAFISVFTLVIKDNYKTYDAEWLFQKVREQVEDLYGNINDDETLVIIEMSEKLLNISILHERLAPMVALLKQLLLTDQPELSNTIKIFFKRLLDSGLKKRVVLELAVDLYKQLRDTGNFPEEELDKYLIRSLNAKRAEDRYDAYRIMIKHILYKDMYNKASKWLAGEEISDDSETKKFAWLSRLDYCILSFFDHFTVHKEAKEYELLQGNEENCFNEELPRLMKDITGDKCLDSWLKLLQYEDMWRVRFILLEESVTKIRYLDGRTDERNNMPLSLAGDIIETWLYILRPVNAAAEEITATEKMVQYVELVKKTVEKKRLAELVSYWRRKARRIYCDSIIFYKKYSNKTKEENAEIIRKLKLRRACAELFIEMMENENDVT
jgi:hypothetical protein